MTATATAMHPDNDSHEPARQLTEEQQKQFNELETSVGGQEFECIKKGNFNPSVIMGEIINNPKVDRDIFAAYLEYSVSHLSKIKCERPPLRGVMSEKHLHKLSKLTGIPFLPMLIANAAKRLPEGITEEVNEQFRSIFGYESDLPASMVPGLLPKVAEAIDIAMERVEIEAAEELEDEVDSEQPEDPKVRIFEHIRIENVDTFLSATPSDRLRTLTIQSISRQLTNPLFIEDPNAVYIRHYGESMTMDTHSRGTIQDAAILEVQLSKDLLIGDAESDLKIKSGDTVYAQLPDEKTANCYIYERIDDENGVYELYRHTNRSIVPTARTVYADSGLFRDIEKQRIIFGKVMRVVHSSVSDSSSL